MKRKMIRNWIKEENRILTFLKSFGIDVESVLVLDILKEFNFLRKLTLEYAEAKQNDNEETMKFKKAVISKVWESIKEELTPGSELIESKKAHVHGWTEAMKVNDAIVIDTLLSLQFNPDDLL